MLKTIFIMVTLLAALIIPAQATQITNVKVDLLKGYAKDIVNTSDSAYYYMGRLTYTFKAEGKDSVWLDFVINKKGTTDSLLIYEKTGDCGLVKQTNTADTLKTIYFRARILDDVSGAYVATITASAEMSKMWQKADSLVALMTNAQKLTLLYSKTDVADLKGFGSDDITLSDGRLMVGWRSADGPHGIRFPVTGPITTIATFGSGDTATVFATEAALGCTFDTSMARRVGQAIAQEALAMGIYCNLGPMSDLVINPRWGRAFETMGEDPYMCGKMASHQVIGIQNEHVIATPKHFVSYCKEEYREGLTVIVSERALRELFCVPYEMDIKEGKAKAIMTCYNMVKVPGFTEDCGSCLKGSVNHHLITDILRNDWGFDGIITTDWNGCTDWINEDTIYNADFEMSMPDGIGLLNTVDKIDAGSWSVDILNKRARRVTYGKLWAWQGKLLTSDDQIKTYSKSTIASSEHLSLTLEEARESIVLAKNDSVNGSPVLPLDKTATMTVAVVGPYSNIFRSGGGGSSAVTPDSQITPLQGIKTLLANSNITIDTDYTNADVAIVFVGVDKEEENSDKTSMALSTSPVDQAALVTAVMAKVPKTIVVYTGGSASVAGSWSNAPGVVIAFYPGRNQAKAIAEILFGYVNPSGHLSVTFPKTVDDLPSYEMTDYSYTYTSADTAHGYFYFEKTKKTPLFWFGHGMSYTTFKYNSIKVVGGPSIASGERVDVKVSVSNTGSMAGDEVVQLYVKPTTTSSIARRVKDLRGFSRVSLAAGETKTVTMTLGARDFSVYEVDATAKSGKWTVIPGTYDLIAGSTSNPDELVDGNGKCVISSLTVQ
jgi:beta-glucosidase